jgi:hypothetical protein
MTWDELGLTLRILDYRLSSTEAVSLLLQTCDIPYPKGQACSPSDPDVNDDEVVNLGKSASKVYFGINAIVNRGRIFPSTVGTGQGYTFAKLNEYATAALYEHFSSKGHKVVQEKGDQLLATSQRFTELQKEAIGAEP